MAISQKVENDLKAALKAKDELAKSCLRLVRAALRGKAKDLRRELEESEEIQVLGTIAKQRKDAAEQFKAGQRPDLVERELAELAIIEGYLPAQMDTDQINQVLEEVFAQEEPQGMRDMGRMMKAAMARFQGQADGKLVNQLVRQRLQG